MTQIYQHFLPLFVAFQKVEVVNPTSSAILEGIIFDKGETHFRPVPNSEGYFQVLAGCPITSDENLLRLAVFDRMLQTVRKCPLSPQDKSAFEVLFEDWDSNTYLNFDTSER